VSSPRRRSRYVSQRSRKAGLPPGSLVYIGHNTQPTSARITVMEFSADHFEERVIQHPDELLTLKPAPTVTWVNVDGVHQEGLLAELGQIFKLHPLLLEDVLNTEQRPKCEQTQQHVYIILKMFDFDETRQEVLTEQVSLVLGSNLLITFLEQSGEEFDSIRERLRLAGSRLRRGGADYLAYSLIDSVVDRYFTVLEKIGTCLEELEDRVLIQMPHDTLGRLHHIKRELIFLRKYIWPVREVISALQHSDSEHLSDAIQPYLRDVYDHTIQAMDTLETYRDLLSGIQDLYHSILSNRMNEIMKVLTIISTLFIPLTFIVGVYGMNFHFMPELEIPWAYPAVWLVMIAIAISMLFFFRRRHWL
jgi:magnesium transporter